MSVCLSEPSYTRIPVTSPGDRITLSHIALSEMIAQSFHEGRVTAVRDVCELFDELLFDDVGDALATIAPALHHLEIEEKEIAT